jgi:hypothetical protein
MGKWLSTLKPEFPTYLGKSTARTAKTTAGDFCQLVQHYGIDRQFLLTIEEIMAGLDADDLAELETLDRHNKQTWAEMLAHRLCKGRTTTPAGTAEGERQPGRQQQDTRTND